MEIEKYSAKWLLNEIKKSKTDAYALFKILDFREALIKQCDMLNVSKRFSNSWNFAKEFKKSKEYKRLTDVQKVEKDRAFLTACKIYDWLDSLNER